MVPPLQLLDAQPQVPSAPQRVPQPPQLFGSLAVTASQAFVPSLSQSLCPLEQAEHVPLLQYCDDVHVLVQLPQWLPSVAVFVSQVPLPSQSAVPGAHAETQFPLEQFGVEAGQTWPQDPQLFGSVLVSTSQPFVRALPSQSA